LYLKLLHSFAANYGDDFEKTVKLIEEGKIIEAEEECHKLKGLCGNLGAEVYDDLCKLDDSLKNNNGYDYIHIGKTADLYSKTIESINSFFENSGSGIGGAQAGAIERGDVSVLLSKINDNLELDIGVAMDDFEIFKKSASLYISGVVLEKMDKALASFDIENMRELIAETMLKLKAKEGVTYE
jgi:HPt (histidine-containing phosphotransfer) domain-containing protein